MMTPKHIKSSNVPAMLVALLAVAFPQLQPESRAAVDLSVPARAKAPFRVLYNNDTTNITACISPFFKKGQVFAAEMIDASVAEASGADAHMFSPGLVWVPFWKSSLYPPGEHFRWWQKTFPNGRLHPIAHYLLDGGDIVADFVKSCRTHGVAAFVSIRLNDYHRVEFLDAPGDARLEEFDSICIDRFRREHPGWRIRPPAIHDRGSHMADDADSRSVFEARDMGVMNWAEPGVRARMAAFIDELAENYDIDGIELDFLRHYRFFRPDAALTPAERSRIMTGFVSQVRRTLDRTAPAGKRRWLCVRIPAVLSMHDPLGIDAAAFADAGADMLNLSSNYFTVQQDVDVAAVRRLAPGASIYLEMNQCTAKGPDVSRGHGDNFTYRRTTDEQFLTTARLALARGADGVSLFNFAYYRDYGEDPSRGPFNEPPFHILPQLADPARVMAATPCHYYLVPMWRSPYGNPVQLPRNLGPGDTTALHMDLVAPASGWQKTSRLRIQTKDLMPANATWSASLNSAPLAPATDISEPLAPPYSPLLGTPQTLRAWSIPPALLKDGQNKIEITLREGSAAEIIFADIITE
jgi:hypothetical protein